MKEEDAAEFLNELAERQGVACSTVKDGHILVFKRHVLQKLLDDNPNQEKLIIFIQRPGLAS